MLAISVSQIVAFPSLILILYYESVIWWIVQVFQYSAWWWLAFYIFQARNVKTNEVVAIKKMSYSGKQSSEVRLLVKLLLIQYMYHQYNITLLMALRVKKCY